MTTAVAAKATMGLRSEGKAEITKALHHLTIKDQLPLASATWLACAPGPISRPRKPSGLQVSNPLRKWGLAVAARRGRNKAAVAVARKLCVAVWHVMQGHVIGAIERTGSLHIKLHKLATEVGAPTIKAMAYETKTAFVQQQLYLLRSYPSPNYMSASFG